MSQDARTLRHLPFFEALAALDESSADWRATTAGLVVLRFVDAWFDEGAHVASDDAWGLSAVRTAVEEIDAGNPARAILGSVVDAISESAAPDFSVVAPRLSAYGRALHFDAKWRLASDVYETLLVYAHPIDEADVYIDASMQLGFCSRMIGAWDKAAAAYSDAGRVAMSMGDVVGILRAQIADARLSMARGNLPRAEEILDRTIERAKAASLPDVTGLALHERATLAQYRGEFEESIRFGYQALGHLTVQNAKDRALADIAIAFMELGVRSVARDAFLILAATAQEQYTRWASQLNLIELSALEGSEPAFETYRRELADVALPVAMQVDYHLLVGKGYAVFGRTARARRNLLRAVELAGTHRLHQLLFKAEESLRNLESGARDTSVPNMPFAPSSVEDVVHAIHTMKETALIGT